MWFSSSIVISSSSVYSISLLNTTLLQYKINSKTINLHAGSINKLKNLDEYFFIIYILYILTLICVFNYKIDKLAYPLLIYLIFL
jgi:hypothetical protein